jgi:hypothetical protein
VASFVVPANAGTTVISRRGACVFPDLNFKQLTASLRGANGSRECAPDDRLRDEAIHQAAQKMWIASLRSQ